MVIFAMLFEAVCEKVRVARVIGDKCCTRRRERKRDIVEEGLFADELGDVVMIYGRRGRKVRRE